MTNVDFTSGYLDGALATLVDNTGLVESCYSTGILNLGFDPGGGLVGDVQGIVRNCYSLVTVNGTGASFTALCSGTIENCYGAGPSASSGFMVYEGTGASSLNSF